MEMAWKQLVDQIYHTDYKLKSGIRYVPCNSDQCHAPHCVVAGPKGQVLLALGHRVIKLPSESRIIGLWTSSTTTKSLELNMMYGPPSHPECLVIMLRWDTTTFEKKIPELGKNHSHHSWTASRWNTELYQPRHGWDPWERETIGSILEGEMVWETWSKEWHWWRIPKPAS